MKNFSLTRHKETGDGTIKITRSNTQEDVFPITLFHTFNSPTARFFLFLMAIPILLFLVFHRLNAAETITWTQTDWSGGQSNTVATGVINTFLAVDSLTTSTAGQLTLTNRAGWYNSAWSYRKKITFNNTQSLLGTASENLTSFPVLVKLDSGTDIDYTKTKDLGEDIRFVDGDGTVLAYEIEKWDETGSSYVWVTVPQIDQESNTDFIYLYYGNSAATDAQNPTAVWDGNFLGVWHMNQTSGTVIEDSTSNNKDGTKTAQSQPSPVSGLIGGSQSFSGSDKVATTINNALGDFTVEVWFKDNGVRSDYERLADKSYTTCFWFGRNASTANSWGGGVRETGAPYGVFVTLTDGEWHQISSIRSGTTHFVYGDGISAQASNTVSSALCDTTPFGIGAWGDASTQQRFGGLIDEVRISNIARSAAWMAASYKSGTDSFSTLSSEEGKLPSSGYVISNVYDSTYPSDWESLTYHSSGNGTISVKARTASSADMSDADDFASCNTIPSGTDLSTTNCVDDTDRYIQYQVTLTPSGPDSPVFEDISLSFKASDGTAPSTNATVLSLANATPNDWTNLEPTITWVEGEDDPLGNGLLGHCISLDEADQDASHALNPALSGGLLHNLDDGVAQTYCPFIALGESLDLSAISGLTLTTGKEYFISIKAVDLAGNIWNGDAQDYQDLTSFLYDNTPPTNPKFISLPGNFVSSKDVTFYWSTAGVDAPNDNHSQLAGLQYKIGENGTWYGDLHTGTEDLNDLLVNDGAYTFDETIDYPNLTEGSNFIYIRTLDFAGNVTSIYTSGVLRLNTQAPSSVLNLSVTPSENTTNSYSFSWDLPESYNGNPNNMTYCISINSPPEENSCTYTAPGTRTVTGAFATRPGSNTFYVVAKDEASNINYETYASRAFSYTGSAPGIPTNLDIADISIKASLNWRLAVTWETPQDTGAGIDHYDVFRTTAEGASCLANFGSFTKVGTVSGTSFVDMNLNQQTYYYCIKACDSANSCGAPSATASRLPDGKFTEPAELTSDPQVGLVTTKRAVITWTTDRASDTKVAYGLTSNTYYEDEAYRSQQELYHSITLNNLTPNTVYYFRAKWTDEDGNTGMSDEITFRTDPAPTVKGVRVGSIGTRSAAITFTSVNAAQVKIYYGQTEAFGGMVDLPTSTEESTYTIPLTNLQDGTPYLYRINTIDIENQEYDGMILDFVTIAMPRISDVTIQEVKGTAQPTLSIDWITNTPTTSIVSYYPENNPTDTKDIIELTYDTTHALSISGLLPETRYVLTAQGTDTLGNRTVSAPFTFTTATDSRPPAISNIRVEGTIVPAPSANEQPSAQLIVSWDTDEPSTSQVEFGEGSTGDFTQNTTEVTDLTSNHVVVIPNLIPSKVYHVRIISKDPAGNTGFSESQVAITPRSTEAVYQVIFGALQDIFTFVRL